MPQENYASNQAFNDYQMKTFEPATQHRQFKIKSKVKKKFEQARKTIPAYEQPAQISKMQNLSNDVDTQSIGSQVSMFKPLNLELPNVPI